MYETVIWATDGSASADAALAEARRLAELAGARLFAVHCDQRLNGRAGGWPALADEEDRRLRIERQVDELREEEVDIELVVQRSHREAADVIAAVAEERGADVIVCGTRGLTVLAGILLGSVAQRLLHVAHCPVLVVPVRVVEKAAEPSEAAGVTA
jgi:nucleotide-binding universal stress UspA family protein